MFLLYIKLKKRNYPYTLKTSARHQKQLCYLLGKKHFIPETVVLPSRKEIYFTGNSWIAFPETIIIYRKHIHIANNTLLFTFANNNYENHLIIWKIASNYTNMSSLAIMKMQKQYPQFVQLLFIIYLFTDEKNRFK